MIQVASMGKDFKKTGNEARREGCELIKLKSVFAAQETTGLDRTTWRGEVDAVSYLSKDQQMQYSRNKQLCHKAGKT